MVEFVLVLPIIGDHLTSWNFSGSGPRTRQEVPYADFHPGRFRCNRRLIKMDLYYAEYRIESSDLRKSPERNVIEAEREGKSLPIQPTYGSDSLIQLFHKRMILNSRHVEVNYAGNSGLCESHRRNMLGIPRMVNSQCTIRLPGLLSISLIRFIVYSGPWMRWP